jgi:hypothetical protein
MYRSFKAGPSIYTWVVPEYYTDEQNKTLRQRKEKVGKVS